MLAFTHYFVFIHIETATEEIVYEVIAEPQEQPEQAQQENQENAAQGPVDPSVEQQLEGKPRSITYYFNLWNVIYLLDYALSFQALNETLVAWSLGSIGRNTSMCRSVALPC